MSAAAAAGWDVLVGVVCVCTGVGGDTPLQDCQSREIGFWRLHFTAEVRQSPHGSVG